MDKITKERLNKLHPSVRAEVANIIHECDLLLTGRAKVRITQGYRTFADQALLYAQGRTKPGPIVTYAKPGQSIHNYGFAVDICLIIDGKVASWDIFGDYDRDKISDWMECVKMFKKYNWEWGGDWDKIKDYPHFGKKPHLDWHKLQRLSKDKDGYVIIK